MVRFVVSLRPDQAQHIRYLEESNQLYITLNGADFVSALSADQLELFQQMVFQYLEFRAAQELPAQLTASECTDLCLQLGSNS